MNEKLLNEIIEKAKKEADEIIKNAKKRAEEEINNFKQLKEEELRKFEEELKKRLEKELYIYENQKRTEVKQKLLEKEKEILEKCYSSMSLTKKEKEQFLTTIANYILKEFKNETVEANEESKEILENKGVKVKVNNNLPLGAVVKGKNFEVNLTLENLKALLKKDVFEKTLEKVGQ